MTTRYAVPLLALVLFAAACGGAKSKTPFRLFESEPLGSCTYTGTGNGQQVFVIDDWTKAQCDSHKGVWTPY